MQYLEPEQHYIDRYDLLTIHRCLHILKIYQATYQKCLTDKRMKDVTEDHKRTYLNRMLHDQLFYAKAEEYAQKQQTIQQWMKQDQVEQDMYDNTPPPQNVRCNHCGTAMYTTFKDLLNYREEPLHVLFFFDCPSCKKRRALYDNGEEWQRKPELCEKCNKEVETTHAKQGEVITWTTKCSACGHTEVHVDDFAKSHAEHEKKEQEDKALLEEYRPEFCFNEKEGKEALETVEAGPVAYAVFHEEKQKYDSQAYTEASQLKRLNIVDLEKLLSEPLVKAQYIKLSFEKPEETRFFIVPFSVQDAHSSRSKNTSEYELKNLLKDLLKGTNWRLMDGIYNRLGYISGRIRGYENKEDLMELYDEKKPQQKSRISDELKQKYASHRLVRLAKMFGEGEGIESARKRRLEKEPDGFFLEASKEGSYNCNVCGERTPTGKTWWNLDGLRCADCWRNIKEGIIPSLHWDNRDKWIRDFEFHSDYGVHPATREKLKRQGILKGRDLKRADGSVYETVYLVEDNAEFLKKYPKKPDTGPGIVWSGQEKGINVEGKKIPNPFNKFNKK